MLSTNRKRPWQGVIGDRCTNITDRAAGFQRREGSRSVCSRSPRPPLLKSENTPGGGTRLHGARGRAPSPIEPASEPGDSSAGRDRVLAIRLFAKPAASLAQKRKYTRL